MKILKILLKTLLAIALVFVLFIIWGVFTMNRPRANVTHALTYQEYTEKHEWTRLPESASNIWHGWGSIGLGGRVHLFRFEAPLEDCKAFAKLEFNHWVGQVYDDPSDYPSDDIIPINEPLDDPRPRFIHHFKFKTLDWFDYDKMTNGLTIHRPRAHLPHIWIDVDRSILYSYWTD